METIETPNPKFEDFENKVESYIQNNRLPNVIALVASNKELLYCKKWGYADVEAKTPIRFDHIFRMASMTKPIVAFGALMLLDEEKLSLNDPLSKYIPKAANLRVFVKEENGILITEPLKREITILDLFIHTIGISYPRDLTHPIEKKFREFNKGYENKWLSEYVEEMLDIPLKVQPGTEWDYGLSLDILAYVMEIVSGESLETFLQKRIFDVLDMNDTSYVVPKEKWDRLTKLTVKSNGELNNAEETMENWIITPKKHKGGGGGLASTLQDYLKFTLCLVNRGNWEGKQILSHKSIELMMKEYVVSRNIPFEGLRGFPKTKETTLQYMKDYSKGYGQALGAQIKITSGIVPSGIYGWAGAFTTDFWVDLENQVIGIIFSQLFPNFRTPVFTEFKEAAYNALSQLQN